MLLCRSDNRAFPRTELSDWLARAALTAIAVGGTLAYAASFRAVPGAPRLAAAGDSVGWAAGLAWPAFGAVLLGVTGARPSPLKWADACLRTMAAGVGVLGPAAALNIFAGAQGAPTPWLVPAHATLLAVSNGVMCAVFVPQARRLGMSPAVAVTLWTVALNGSFVAILFVPYMIGVM